MLQCKEAAEDLRDTLAELAKQKFDLVQKQFEGALAKIEHRLTMLDKKREIGEYTGGGKGYAKEARLLAKEYKKQEKELEALKKKQQEYLDAGGSKRSEAYQEMQREIESLEEAMQDTILQTYELAKQKFDDVQEKFEGKLDRITHRLTMLGKQQELSYYTGEDKQFGKQGRLLDKQYKTQQKELDKLKEKQQEFLDAGGKKGSKKWREMQSEIEGVEEAMAETVLQQHQLAKEQFDWISTQYGNKADRQQHKVATVQGEITDSTFSAAGSQDGGLYEKLAKAEGKAIDIQKKKLEELKKARDEAVESGMIAEGSEAWHEMTAEIEAAEEEIQQSTTDIKQIYIDAFEAIQGEFDNRISAIDHQVAMLEGKLAAAQYTNEDKGAIYSDLERAQNDRLKERQAELQRLQRALAEAVANGTEVGSDKWYKLQSEIDSVMEDIQKTETEIKSLYKDAFDAIEKSFENRIGRIDSQIGILESRLSAAAYTTEDKGSIYAGMVGAQQVKLGQQQAELQSLQQSMAQAVANGVEVGSDVWYEMQSKIDSVTEGIIQTQTEIKALYKEVFDSIQRDFENRISAIDRGLSLLEGRLSAAAYTTSDKGSIYGSMMKTQTAKLGQQQAELSRLQQAMAEAVANGIAVGSDTWYAMQGQIDSVTESIQQTQTEIKALYKDVFDVIQKEFENRISLIDHGLTMLEGRLSAAQYTVDNKSSIYGGMVNTQTAKLRQQQAELQRLQQAMAEAVANGTAVGSDVWFEMQGQIDSITESIQQTQTEIRGLYKESFDAIEQEYTKRMSTLDRLRTSYDNKSTISKYNGEAKKFLSMINVERARLKDLYAERETLQRSMDEALSATNGIEKGSDAWNEMQDSIAAVDEAIQQAGINIAELFEERFNDIATQYEMRLGSISSKLDLISKKNSVLQYTGGAENITSQFSGDIQSMALLTSQLQEMQKAMKDAVNAKYGIKEGSEAWIEMQEKIDSVTGSIIDMKNNVAQLFTEAFNSIQTRFDNTIGMIGRITGSIESDLSEIEKRGYIGGQNMYRQMIQVEQTGIATQKKELVSLQRAMQAALDAGIIKEGSQAWIDQKAAIDDVTSSIRDAELKILDYKNAIRQINWDVFDRMQDGMASVSDEAQFFISLMENSKLFDDQGKMTDTGIATTGMYAMRYDVEMAQADKYAKEIKELNAEIAKDPSNTTLIDRRKELIGLQRDSILAAEQEKQAVKSLVEEGINAELESLQDLIDAYNDSLDAQRDLYDYQKRIAEQTKNIASLQKQLSAYEGDDSEENKARVQRLQLDLSEAQTELQETQYEQYISDQKKLLDDLYTNYESLLNSRLDDVNALMQTMIDMSNVNAASIRDTLQQQGAAVGIGLSDSMYTVWNDSLQPALSLYTTDFTTQATNMNTVLSGIDASIRSMVDTTFVNIDTNLEDVKTYSETALNEINNVVAQLQSMADAINGDAGTNNAIKSAEAAIKSVDSSISGENGATQQIIAAKSAIESVGEAITHEGETITTMRETKAAVVDLHDDITGDGGTTKTIGEVRDQVTAVYNAVTGDGGTTKTIGEVRDQVTAVYNALSGEVGTTQTIIKSSDDLKNAIGDTKNAIEGAEDAVDQQMMAVADASVQSLTANINEIVKSAVQGTNTSSTQKTTTVINTVTSMIKNAIQAINQVRSEVSSSSKGQQHNVSQNTGKIKDSVSTWGGKVNSSVGDVKRRLDRINPRISTTFYNDSNGNPSSSYSYISGFSEGGFVADLQKIALHNGDDIVTVNTLKKGEAVFKEKDYKNIAKLVDAVPQIQGVMDVSKLMMQSNGVSNVMSESKIDVGGVSIQIDHVEDYDDLVRHMRDDKTFEKMIRSMTIDPLTNKYGLSSGIAKKKYYN